ncbi:MAG: uracil-DNA glycosylase, partial [Patescibacteria group bacterium]
MAVQIEQSWKEKLSEEFEKQYFEALTTFVREEYKNGTV